MLCDGLCTVRYGSLCCVMTMYCEIWKLMLCDGLCTMRKGSLCCVMGYVL